MKHLLNTLFVTSEDIYLSLDGENVVANREREAVARYPLHALQSIVTFSYAGASPALLGACTERGIGLAFCTPRGKFLARVSGASSGNVLLRRAQYRAADDPVQSCRIARTMIFGKLYNARWSIERTCRDHGLRVDAEKLSGVSARIKSLLPQVREETSPDSLRGLEGIGAAAYFDVFDDMILNRKDTFYFHGRNRRPPMDAVNALLSFAYSLLAHDFPQAVLYLPTQLHGKQNRHPMPGLAIVKRSLRNGTAQHLLQTHGLAAELQFIRPVRFWPPALIFHGIWLPCAAPAMERDPGWIPVKLDHITLTGYTEGR